MTAVERLSVVIPTYQRRDSIEFAVRSVIDQHDPNVEVIVVDDGSTDGTRTVIERLLGVQVRYYHQANAGRCAARNRGIDVSSGSWLVFLDSDDALVPGSLARFRTQLGGNDLVLAATVRVSPDATESVVPAPYEPSRRLPSGMQAGAFAIKRSLLDRIGAYCERLEFSEHTEMAFRMRRLDPVPRVAVLPDATVRVTERPNRYDPDVQYRTAVHLLDHIGPELDNDHNARARFHGIAGVAASRLGRRRAARAHLSRSLRDDPSMKAAARLCLAATGLDSLGARWNRRSAP